VYLILVFIGASSLSPVASAEDADSGAPQGEADGDDTVANAPNAVEALLRTAVRHIFGDHTMRIEEGTLRCPERDVVLRLVLQVFGGIPLEIKSHRRFQYRVFGGQKAIRMYGEIYGSFRRTCRNWEAKPQPAIPSQ
jgi:hypothetical protein